MSCHNCSLKKKHIIQGYATLANGYTFGWERYIDIRLSLQEAMHTAKRNVISNHAGSIHYLWTPKVT